MEKQSSGSLWRGFPLGGPAGAISKLALTPPHALLRWGPPSRVTECEARWVGVLGMALTHHAHGDEDGDLVDRVHHRLCKEEEQLFCEEMCHQLLAPQT